VGKDGPAKSVEFVASTAVAERRQGLWPDVEPQRVCRRPVGSLQRAHVRGLRRGWRPTRRDHPAIARCEDDPTVRSANQSMAPWRTTTRELRPAATNGIDVRVPPFSAAAPGSHLEGRVAEKDIRRVVEGMRCCAMFCARRRRLALRYANPSCVAVSKQTWSPTRSSGGLRRGCVAWRPRMARIARMLADPPAANVRNIGRPMTIRGPQRTRAADREAPIVPDLRAAVAPTASLNH
jgi:hypothetical protein